MAEEKPAGLKGTISGWMKAGVASIVSLVSGAVLMYLTPLVNNAIKPAKPVANFATDSSGLNLQINNRSTGATRGWWDFGDGTALEPYDPNVETIKHLYAKPGKYDVKLSVQNMLNEESVRNASVNLDPPVPEITLFKLVPVSDEQTPAVYRLQAKVKNASYCIFSFDDARPMEIIEDANQDRYITFDEMGAYTVRLAAVSGKQLVEKTQQLYISPGERDLPLAKLQVSYQVVKVDRSLPKDWRITCDWPTDATGSVVTFRKERTAPGGGTFVSAELLNKGEKTGAVQNVNLDLTPDKTKLILTGELKKPSGLLGSKTAPSWTAAVRVVIEHRSQPQLVDHGAVSMPLALNKPVKLPLQPVDAGWQVVRTNMKLEVFEGARKVWEGSKPVTDAKVTVKNQACLLTAIQASDGVVVKLDASALVPVTHTPPVTPISHLPSISPVGPVVRPAGFERNPLFPMRPMKN